MGKLDGKVALITGSGRNIGRATALKFAGEGAHVVVNARANQQEAELVAREVRDLGVKAAPILADVGNKAEVEGLAEKALSEFGRVDILVNNAAIRPHKPFTEVTDEDWERVRNVVLDGAFYLTRALIPSMVKNKYGRILFFCGDGSISAQRHRPRPSVGGEDGADRDGARARLGIRGAQHPGQCRLARQHRYAARQSRNGTPPRRAAICRTLAASRSAARARSTRSPRPACSWSARTAASSPARRSTSTAARITTDPRQTSFRGMRRWRC